MVFGDVSGRKGKSKKSQTSSEGTELPAVNTINAVIVKEVDGEVVSTTKIFGK
jgi:hypothetical protein